MFERLELLIGSENVERLHEKTVCVLGLGGVGGYVVESLSRSGIGTLILIDYDKVDITNRNRQIIATESTMGEWKVDAWEKRVHEINPNCIVIKKNEKITPESLALVFQNQIDFFIDACDTLEVKKSVIKLCSKRKIPFVSCMGTGNKLDPTKLEILDLRKTINDPIAKILRKMVKEEHINGKIPVICSKEVPIRKGKVIASNSLVPPTAGIFASYYVIKTLLKESL